MDNDKEIDSFLLDIDIKSKPKQIDFSVISTIPLSVQMNDFRERSNEFNIKLFLLNNNKNHEVIESYVEQNKLKLKFEYLPELLIVQSSQKLYTFLINNALDELDMGKKLYKFVYYQIKYKGNKAIWSNLQILFKYCDFSDPLNNIIELLCKHGKFDILISKDFDIHNLKGYDKYGATYIESLFLYFIVYGTRKLDMYIYDFSIILLRKIPYYMYVDLYLTQYTKESNIMFEYHRNEVKIEKHIGESFHDVLQKILYICRRYPDMVDHTHIHIKNMIKIIEEKFNENALSF